MGSDKPWTLSDLPPEKRKAAESQGYVPQKMYIGDPEEDCEEVVVCPFCNTLICKPEACESSRCSHIAFMYDLANGEFVEMDEEFKKQHPSFDLEDRSKFPELKIYEWNDVWGIGGLIWGFWNRENTIFNFKDETWVVETTLGAKEKPFEWRIDPNCFLSIRRRFELKSGARYVEKTITPEELGKINNYAFQGWCYLANNVEKLQAGTEKDGIGSFLFNTLGWDVTDSQLASQLAAIFFRSGAWHYDGKKRNMKFKAIQSDWCKCLQDYSSKSV